MASGAPKASFPPSLGTWPGPLPVEAAVLASTVALVPRTTFPRMSPRAQLPSEPQVPPGQSHPAPSPRGASPRTGKSRSLRTALRSGHPPAEAEQGHWAEEGGSEVRSRGGRPQTGMSPAPPPCRGAGGPTPVTCPGDFEKTSRLTVPEGHPLLARPTTGHRATHRSVGAGTKRWAVRLNPASVQTSAREHRFYPKVTGATDGSGIS